MADRPDDAQSRGSRAARRTAEGPSLSPALRITGIVVGFALAVGATLAVFLTDNALYLRLAVIAVAWAFVIAAFSAGRRKTDQAVAAGREAELRQAYELELEREVAARREYELRLENQLRRETQEAMRAEMDQLRQDLAGLAGLRDQLAGLGELKSDMSRLRHELTEQLSGEMLVERIVMRTQSIRMPSDRPRLDPAPVWEAPQLPEPTPQAQPDPAPVRTSTPLVPVPAPVPVEPTRAPARVETEPPPSPRDWFGEQHRTAEPEPAPRWEATTSWDAIREPEPTGTLWEAPAAEAPRHSRRAPEEEVVVVVPAEPEHEPDVHQTAGHQRLTEILAESGSTAGASRRRRRYREDDETGEDDVLSRVLNQR